MQQLHLVGFTTDHRALIFSVRRGAKSGSYTVAVDDGLFAAIDDARAWLAETAAPDDASPAAVVDDRPQSQLSVREVQARLRRGMSIDDIADDAGVEPSWVARFAAPVLTEQAEVIRSVRAARFARRTGISGAPLGEAVYRNLVERGVLTPREELDRAWGARQLADGLWEVTFHYSFRKRDQRVSWSYDDATGKLAARDRLASMLAFRPGGPKPTPPRPRGSNAGSRVTANPVEEESAPKPVKASKKMAAARKAAAARMVADAQKATKRNAAVARKAAKRPPRPVPPPTPAVSADKPADDPAAPAAPAPTKVKEVVEPDSWLAELPLVDEERWLPADEVAWSLTRDADASADLDPDEDEVVADGEVAGDPADDDAADDEVADVDDGVAEIDDEDPADDADELPADDVVEQPVARRRAPLRARPVEPAPARKIMRLRVEQPTIRAQQASGLDADDAAPRPRRRQLRAR